MAITQVQTFGWTIEQIAIYRALLKGYTSYTQLVGFDGYGFYEDDANPQNDSGLLQTNTKIVKLDDAPAVIPVDTSKTTQVTYELNGEPNIYKGGY